MTSESPCWVAPSTFRLLVDQIMNGNRFVYMHDLPPNLGIRKQYTSYINLNMDCGFCAKPLKKKRLFLGELC